ncbi:MAG: FAD-binding oxidoreductase [Acidobacteriota bacterium]
MATLARRTLLQTLAAAVFAGVPRPLRAAGERIVIAGGGIIGANLAYRLARRGADVTLLEKARPAAAATANSFAWINSTYSKEPHAYFQLNRLGIEAWHQLESELRGLLPLRWGGSIEWYGDEKAAAAFRGEVKRHQAWGYPAHLIDARALRALEPNVEPGPIAVAGHALLEGHVDPVIATERLLERAAAAGARVRHPAEVTGLDQAHGRLRAVRTAAGDIEADVLIVACGTDTPRVAALAGVAVPLRESPGVLVHTAPQPAVIERVVLAPVAHMKQKPDGRLVMGSGFGGTPTQDTSVEAAERFLKTARGVLPALASARVEKVTLGWRPLPQDGFPVIGFPPGRRDVYIAVMHSGVTLAPLVAHLAALEILDGVAADPLAPYRPARFG